MKKIYVSFALVLAGGVAMAQSFSTIELKSSTAKALPISVNSTSAIDATDTLGLEGYGESLFQYGGVDGGYIFGTSDSEFDVEGTIVHQYTEEFAAGFIVNDPYKVIGAMVWFGGKTDVSGSPANVKVKMYTLGDDEAYADASSQSPDATGPDQVLASVDVPFSDIEVVNLRTFAIFDEPIFVDEDFALSVDITDLYSSPVDTAWLYASEDGASDGSYTWTKVGFDISAQKVWSLTSGLIDGSFNVNLAIFAIVSESEVGIEEQGFLNGVKMTTYPNPALVSNNINIDFALETAADNVDLTIFNLEGKMVFSSTLGAKLSGIHSLDIPAGTLAAGSYVYALNADGRKMAKRLEILK